MRRKTVKSQQLLHLARKRQEKPLYVTIRVSLKKLTGCLPQTTRPQFPPNEDSESEENGNSKMSFSPYKRNARPNKRIKR